MLRDVAAVVAAAPVRRVALSLRQVVFLDAHAAGRLIGLQSGPARLLSLPGLLDVLTAPS